MPASRRAPIPRHARVRGRAGVRRARAGMTLIEVIVVLIIVALAATGITYTLGAITRANLRSACMTLTAASRYAYGRAISQNSTVRLLFDLNEDRMSFEEAHGRVTLARLDDPTREELEEEGEGDGAAVDPWAAAQARLDDTLNPSFGASPFSVIPGSRYEPQELANRVHIRRLIVPHEPEPRTEGRGALYFFPGGHTEHAVIWVGDDEDRVYSVEVHPLTGRTRVYDYAYEPEELLDDGRGGSRSEVDD
ncbi:MAG TPA: prepilin-type N-terminal cleavage/methylation domain-containing protein [Sandaracinaceae bacterium LLY-WYZ-13_1]|nr:prepilin-type N-terminal cleavage/methylation domain-containing protein [Sandaracinaceae bacterium LLY-WYZ-13_1]